MSSTSATLPAGGAVGGARRFWNMTLTLAFSQFKLRYFGSVLGYVWTLAKPLILFGILYLAFTEFLRFGGGIPFYPAFLITAIVLWTFFSDATGAAVDSLVAQEGLIRKMPMPLLVIPLSTVMVAFFNLTLNLVAVLVFIAISGVEVTWRWLEFPLLLLCLMVFTTAMAGLVATLYVPFRDMKQIWEVVLTAGFWGSAIIYPIEVAPESVREYLLYNPLATVMVQMRHAIIDPSAPSAVDVLGGWGMLAVPGGIGLLLLAITVYSHRKIAPQIAEQL